jgi:hypothetical protein
VLAPGALLLGAVEQLGELVGRSHPVERLPGAAVEALGDLVEALLADAGEAVALGEVRLISLGTGTSLQYIEGAVHDWGYAQWAKPLISLLLGGVNGIADFQCRQILGESYHRLAPVFPPNVSLPPDGVDRLDYLSEFAESVDLTETVAWVRDKWNR